MFNDLKIWQSIGLDSPLLLFYEKSQFLIIKTEFPRVIKALASEIGLQMSVTLLFVGRMTLKFASRPAWLVPSFAILWWQKGLL